MAKSSPKSALAARFTQNMEKFVGKIDDTIITQGGPQL